MENRNIQCQEVNNRHHVLGTFGTQIAVLNDRQCHVLILQITTQYQQLTVKVFKTAINKTNTIFAPIQYALLLAHESIHPKQQEEHTKHTMLSPVAVDCILLML